MTTRHTISHADELYRGNVQYNLYTPDGRRGLKIDQVTVVNFGAPDTLDSDGILNGVTIETDTVLSYTAGDLALTTLDVPRNITVVSTDGTQADHVVTVTGLDTYGETLVENLTLNGTTTVAGLKAFASVSAVSAAAGAEATTLDVGWGDKLGLPVKLVDSSYVMSVRLDGTAVGATIAVASDTTATATTGDVRGTLLPATSTNGARKYTALIYVPDVSTKVSVFGQDQFGG